LHLRRSKAQARTPTSQRWQAGCSRCGSGTGHRQPLRSRRPGCSLGPFTVDRAMLRCKFTLICASVSPCRSRAGGCDSGATTRCDFGLSAAAPATSPPANPQNDQRAQGTAGCAFTFLPWPRPRFVLVLDAEAQPFMRNEKNGLNAASNVKLVTCGSAHSARPEFRWKTAVLGLAPAEVACGQPAGELQGDLFLRASAIRRSPA